MRQFDDLRSLSQLRDQLRPYWIDDLRSYANIGDSATTGATLTDISAAIAAHRLEADPHPTYLTATEADALFLTPSEVSGLYYSKASLDGGALDTRYYTKSESESRYVNVTGDTMTGQLAINPGSVMAPLILGANTQNQTVVGLRADQLNRTVTAGAGLSGAGALTADVTISLGTPSTLTQSSTNSASGTTHSHAITSSNNPGAAASILASSAAGQLTLPLFVASTSVSTPALITAAGDLTITPAGSNVAIASGKAVRSTYTSGWAGAGYQLDYSVTNASRSFLEVDDISVRGTLNVYELLINQIRATNGTEIVSSVAKLASVAGSTWTFENADGANLCPFAVGDILLIQRATVAAGTLIKRIVRKVATVTGASITVGTATGGPADTGSPAKGDMVVRVGSETDANRRGTILLTSDMSNAPYLDVISGVDLWSAWGGTAKTKLRLGLLTGITGTANEYGLIAGSGFTATDSYIKLSTSAVVQNNVDSYWRISGVDNVRINSANGLNVKAAGASTYPNPVASGVSWWASTLGSGTQVAQVGASTDGSFGSNLWLSAYQTATFGGAVKITATGTDTSYSQFQVAGSSAGFGGNIYGKVNSTGYLLFQVGTKELYYDNGGFYVGPNGASKSKLYLTDTWGNHPSDVGELNAEIANDDGTYKALMLGGNRADGGSHRRIMLLDHVHLGSNVLGSTAQPQQITGGNSDRIFSLAINAFGRATSLMANAYKSADSGHIFTSGQATYYGGQAVTTAPLLYHMDPNAVEFKWYYGPTNLASGASITTWTIAARLATTHFGANALRTLTEGFDWKLSGYTAGAPAATGYVLININGTNYKLLAST